MKPTIGIYSPGWLLGKYNTDHRIVKSFGKLDLFADITTEFVASRSYTWSVNIKKIAGFAGLDLTERISHGLKKKYRPDLIYHYGEPVLPESFFKLTENLPVLVTTGFMTDKYVRTEFGKITDRRQEADQLAKKLDKAAMIHFHTEGGRHRFLNYRPEFQEKTISIPFFLPALKIHEKTNVRDETKINLLFVGYHGKRKGLHELIKALDILGTTYLNNNKVAVTIVSKDKPQPATNFNLTWHDKLNNQQILELMQSSSIFVLVPKLESYGLVLIEAMLSGCAIITDDDDTRQEILGDTGVLLPTGSPESIASSLRLLIENSAYRKELGKNAFLRAKNKFIPEIVAEQYFKCFTSLL